MCRTVFDQAFCYTGSNGTRHNNIVPSVEEVSQVLVLSSQSQTPLVVTIPFVIDMAALEDPEIVYLRMELVSPAPENVKVVEPTLAVISILDNSELLLICIP